MIILVYFILSGRTPDFAAIYGIISCITIGFIKPRDRLSLKDLWNCLASGAKKNDQIVFTIDHHYGSEEHQIDQEYFDESNYDKSLGRINTVPLLQKNLSKIKEINNVIPLIGDANLVSRFWQMKIGLLFIDGSHTKKSAENDFNNWQEKIVGGGALVIHDIYENPEEGGQAPYEIFQLALKSGYELFDREDTIVCLKKLIG